MDSEPTDGLFLATHIPDSLLHMCYMRPSAPSSLTPSPSTSTSTPHYDSRFVCPPTLTLADICPFKPIPSDLVLPTTAYPSNPSTSSTATTTHHDRKRLDRKSDSTPSSTTLDLSHAAADIKQRLDQELELTADNKQALLLAAAASKPWQPLFDTPAFESLSCSQLQVLLCTPGAPHDRSQPDQTVRV